MLEHLAFGDTGREAVFEHRQIVCVPAIPAEQSAGAVEITGNGTRILVQFKFGRRGGDDARKNLPDPVVENLVPLRPVESLDDGAAQGLVAGILLRVGMVTNASVIHVEIGMYKAGFQVGDQVVIFGQHGVQGRWITLLQNLVELADGYFDEIQFSGREGVPASCIFSDEFDFDAVCQGRDTSLKSFQVKLGVGGFIESLCFQAERFFPEAWITHQYGTGAVE